MQNEFHFCVKCCKCVGKQLSKIQTSTNASAFFLLQFAWNQAEIWTILSYYHKLVLLKVCLPTYICTHIHPYRLSHHCLAPLKKAFTHCFPTFHSLQFVMTEYWQAFEMALKRATVVSRNRSFFLNPYSVIKSWSHDRKLPPAFKVSTGSPEAPAARQINPI